MGLLEGRRFASLALAVAGVVLLLLVACARQPTPTPTPTPVPTITVSLLIQGSQEDVKWFRNVQVPKGTNAYELTEQVTGGNLDATWYPQYRSHFVNALIGVKNQDPSYWLVYLWDEPQAKWDPLPVGADLYSLKEGHILAWAYTDTSKKPSPLPSVKP